MAGRFKAWARYTVDKRDVSFEIMVPGILVMCCDGVWLIEKDKEREI